MRKICLVNQKGGCGKTTTAINLASCFANKGRRVLLIDLDPQGHSGLGFGVKPEQVQNTIYEVLLGQIPLATAIRSLNENLDAVFSDVVLSAFEQLLAGAPEREFKLAQSLAGSDNKYDYVVIDCPPNLGLLTFNALMASDEIIIPVDSSFFALHGLDKLLETLQLIEEKARHKLSFKILATNVDLRTRFSRKMVDELRARFGEKCFNTVIHICTRLREAAAEGKPIDGFDRHCTAFRDYQNLAKEVIEDQNQMETKTYHLGYHQEGLERSTDSGGREVVFTVPAPGHATVQIAGDFNDWIPEHLHFIELQGKAVWQRAISLEPGSYQYKYLIDGSWMPDPENDKTVDDSRGGVNSVINV